MFLADITSEQVLAFMTPLAVIVAAIVNWLIARNAAKAASLAAERAAEVKQDLASTQAVLDHKLDVAAVRTEKVKTDLAANHQQVAAKLDNIQSTGEINHTLLNSRMGSVLKSLATMARRLAIQTGEGTDDVAALAAEEMSKDHEAKQGIVDSK